MNTILPIKIDPCLELSIALSFCPIGTVLTLFSPTGPEHGEVSGSYFRGYEEGEMEEQEEDMEDEEGEYHGHHPHHDHLGGIDYQDGSGGGGGGGKG